MFFAFASKLEVGFYLKNKYIAPVNVIKDMIIKISIINPL